MRLSHQDRRTPATRFDVLVAAGLDDLDAAVAWLRTRPGLTPRQLAHRAAAAGIPEDVLDHALAVIADEDAP